MPGDQRIQKLFDHTDAMITLLEAIIDEMNELADKQRSKAQPDKETLAFLEDVAERAEVLSEHLEEEIIGKIIGINNLLGPARHLLDRHGGDDSGD